MEKVAFISGANRGIGFETAKKLAQTGVKSYSRVKRIEERRRSSQKIKSIGITKLT